MTQHGENPREAGVIGDDWSPEPVLKLRAEAVDWREVEGQVVALDRAGSVYLAINQAGTALWPAIVQGATREQLVGILLETFDVESDRATADVDAFVANLSERHLLERSG
ncbi:MAG: PqqD family protein [Actinomycetota bacterium]|nr:PqqD family protein [Actinomycetota bacterium]MDQ3353588.1 PqqD family protein [Actinomycetota bacterium]